jgi:PTS system ascorbate-specific IIA component
MTEPTDSGIRALLSPERVALDVEVSDWREAVRAAGRLMVETGAVEPRYVEAMVSSCERFGPYIVVAPGIALPHSSPDDGVVSDSLAVIVLSHPIDFGNEENDPVHIVLALSAANKQGHLDQLRTLASSLQRLSARGDDWRPLREAITADEVIEVLTSDDLEKQ